MLFFSPYRYRGQLYSIIYGQAIPSVIGQKSVALTLGQGGKIYVRVDSSQDNMRPVISKDEAERLIKQIDEIEAIKITDEKSVEELYKSCMRSYDCIEWVRLIKCIYNRKIKRIESGKKITATDEKYMRLAEEALYSELAIALGISKDKVLEIIMSYH